MSDLEKVQDITMELLKKFLEICEEYHLRYYFTGGALIGVLRHGGFIPWDDDIDIGMPRKDYDEFMRLVKANMPEGYGICDRYTNKDWHFAMSQFVDLNTEIVIHLAEKPRVAHVWIDIFPLDGLPSQRPRRWLRLKYIMLCRYMVQLANINTQVDITRSRSFYEKIIFSLVNFFHLDKRINTDTWLNRLESLLKKDDFDESEYAGNLLGRYREREAVPKSYFGNARQEMFAGVKVNIPERSHELQTALYGDYMTLPPDELRVGHNVSIIKCRE